MRNTARMQVIVLALLGAMAWVSIQSGAVHTAVAGLLGDTTVEQGLEEPPASTDFDAPVLGDRTPHGHRLVIPVHTHRVIFSPTGNIRIVRHASDAFVS